MHLVPSIAGSAVAAAYDWRDLYLGHGFQATRHGERYGISEATPRTIPDRLLAVNNQRYDEQDRAGLPEKGARKRKAKSQQASGAPAAPAQGESNSAGQPT